jgi:hypothetical protein
MKMELKVACSLQRPFSYWAGVNYWKTSGHNSLKQLSSLVVLIIWKLSRKIENRMEGGGDLGLRIKQNRLKLSLE